MSNVTTDNSIQQAPNDAIKTETELRNRKIFKGLVCAMFSGTMYSGAAVIVKELRNIHPAELTVWRFVALFVFSLPVAVKSQQNMMGPRNLRHLLCIRGLLGTMDMFFSFMAFQLLPLGEAAVIIFSLPVFVTIVARIYLNEPCSVLQLLTMLLTMIGIILTANIPQMISTLYSRESLYGFSSAVLALACSTSAIILMRRLKEVHYAVTILTSSLVSLIGSVILTFVITEFKPIGSGFQKWYAIAFGVLSYGGQSLLTLALQYECAGPVSTMRASSDILLAFVWQTYLFDDRPDALSISGAVLVGVSVVIAGFVKYVSSLPNESAIRNRFAWTLK